MIDKELLHEGLAAIKEGYFTLTKEGIELSTYMLYQRVFSEEFPDYPNQFVDSTHMQQLLQILMNRGWLIQGTDEFTEEGGKQLWDILYDLPYDEYMDAKYA